MRKKNPLRFCLAFTLVLLFSFTHTQARAQGIAVIKSHNVEPFNQALAGFVAACDGGITEYDLRGSKRKGAGIIKRIIATKPRLIVAIGSLAALVAKEGARGIPVVFFMVPNPYKFGLEGENIAGISLDIPIDKQCDTR